jgi:hypothetical protein
MLCLGNLKMNFKEIETMGADCNSLLRIWFSEQQSTLAEGLYTTVSHQTNGKFVRVCKIFQQRKPPIKKILVSSSHYVC